LVGHIALAQFGLTMGDVLSQKANDLNWIDERFRKPFRRGSNPIADGPHRHDPSVYRQITASMT